jgi:drug/metabolite transporter (DMT)-like permease
MAFFIGLALAVVAGVFGTVFHQSDSAGLPLGLILSLAGVALLAIEARTSWPKRIGFLISYLPLIYIAAQDFTGDKMIPANELGAIWSYGSVAIVILILMWPSIRR